jgi:putative transcriptional regulator
MTLEVDMTRRKNAKKMPDRRAVDDIMHNLSELAEAVSSGVPLENRFTIHRISIPEPHEYSPATVKKLRGKLGMSQAVFAEVLGVSRVWVQAWERGVRQPSPLARRLMDTIRADPAAWLSSISAKAS